MTELEVLKGAEKVIRRRGYNWQTYGWDSSTSSLCLGGAIGIVLGVAHPHPNPETSEIRHPACARLIKILPPHLMEPWVVYKRDSVLAISRTTENLSEEDVRAALSQAISECQAEEVLAAERELTTV